MQFAVSPEDVSSAFRLVSLESCHCEEPRSLPSHSTEKVPQTGAQDPVHTATRLQFLSSKTTSSFFLCLESIILSEAGSKHHIF
ncbi:mCG147021 [Mus musculus]|nr:mCG147021 [Mus musculus]